MARNFNGTSNHIAIADHDALTLTHSTGWTIAFWFNVTTNTGTTRHHIYSWGNYGGVPSCNIHMPGEDTPDHGNKLSIYIRDSESNSYIFNTTSKPGTNHDVWQHATLVDDLGTLRIYINGVESDTKTGYSSDVDSGATLYLGRRSSSETLHFNGDMAELAKWDVALSTEQITALSNGVRPTEVGSRPAWYLPMLGSLSEEIEDITITNSGTTIAEHPPKIVFPSESISF